MPAIATLNLSTDGTLPAVITPAGIQAHQPVFARKDEAMWQSDRMNSDAGDDSRAVVRYSRRGPVKGQSDLIKHTFRFTQPTMKSVVGEGVPYEPPPMVDFVTVAEFTVWHHPRCPASDIEWAMAALLTQTTTLRGLLDNVVVDGTAIY